MADEVLDTNMLSNQAISARFSAPVVVFAMVPMMNCRTHLALMTNSSSREELVMILLLDVPEPKCSSKPKARETYQGNRLVSEEVCSRYSQLTIAATVGINDAYAIVLSASINGLSFAWKRLRATAAC